MKKYYLPRAIPKRVIWVKNFAAKLPSYNVRFGISAGELAAVVLFSSFYEFLVGYIAQARDWVQGLTEYLTLTGGGNINTALAALPGFTPNPAPPGVIPATEGGFKFINGLVRRIKGTT